MIDQVVGIGLPRLVLFPILASLLGERSFGAFVVALGLIQIVGLSPSNGLIAYVIRDLSRHSEAERALMTRTAMLLSLAVVGPIGLGYMLCTGAIARAYGGAQFLALVPGLAVFLILTNVVEVSLSTHRVERAFGRIAFVHLVQAVALFTGIPLYYAFGVGGVATGYVVAGSCALAVAVAARPDLRTGRLFASAFARPAMRVWFPFSISSFITLSAGYLDRVLLGYWWSPADVAPFFAATSTAAIFLMPATLASNLILSLLGKVQGRASLGPGFYGRYAAAALAFSAIVFAVGAAIGPLIVRLLYPAFFADAQPLWIGAMGAFSIMGIQAFARPFVCKFLAPGWLPVLAGAGLVARVLPLVLLVPTGGAAGAVTALLIGSIVTSLIWATAFVNGFIRKGAELDATACAESLVD